MHPTYTRENKAKVALHHLREARDLLKEVGAVRALVRVNHAISSTEGAVRAAMYRDMRTAETTVKS